MSQAAEELHVTHGAVSRQIRVLEDDLGCALFERRGRGLALTAEGRRLRETAGEALDLLRAARERLRRGTRNRALVLGCPGSLLARWMIPRLEGLRRDMPDLDLHLAASEGTPDAALAGMDAALLIASPPWPSSWQVHELAEEQIGPVMTPALAARLAPTGRGADALLGHTLLHTASRPQAWPDWARAQGLAVDALRMGQSFEHLYYLLEAAVAGLGVAIAPRRLVSDDLAAGRLLAPWGFVATAGRWLLCAPGDAADPRIGALGDWLRGMLQSPDG